MGAMDKIEVWSKEVYNDSKKENMFNDEEFIAKLEKNTIYRAKMTFRHVPVLYDEVMESLNIRPDGVLCGRNHRRRRAFFRNLRTVIRSGHTPGSGPGYGRAGSLPKRLEPYSCKKIFLHSNYSEVDRILETAGRPVDGNSVGFGRILVSAEYGGTGICPCTMRRWICG